jgi:hypothetical protein
MSNSLSDLQTPVRFLTQGLKSGLCVYMNNAPANISNFAVKSVVNAQNFNQTISNTFGINGNFNTKNYFQTIPFINITIPQLYNSLALNSTSATVASTKFIFNYRV